MKAFIKSKNLLEGDVVLRGVRPGAFSSKKDTDSKKPEVDTLSETELSKREALDAKAIYFLDCALSSTEYNRISSCDYAKEI